MRKLLFLTAVILLLLLSVNNILDVKQTNGYTTTVHVDEDPHPNLSHLENANYATPDNPVISPSGKYKMVIESGYNGTVWYNSFNIYNMDDNTLQFSSSAQFRTRDRLMFAWDAQDNVWIYTADMGVYWWEKEDNIWVNNNKKIEKEDYQEIFSVL